MRTITVINGAGQSETRELVGGYRRKDGTARLVTSDQLLDHGLLELTDTDGNVLWAGALHRTAAARFDDTAAGGTFRYRNAPLVTFTDTELDAIDGTTVTITGVAID